MENQQNLQKGLPLNVNPADLPYLECEKCQSQVFTERLMIKKVSKLLTGSQQDGIIPIPVIACASCGHVIGSI